MNRSLFARWMAERPAILPNTPMIFYDANGDAGTGLCAWLRANRSGGSPHCQSKLWHS